MDIQALGNVAIHHSCFSDSSQVPRELTPKRGKFITMRDAHILKEVNARTRSLREMNPDAIPELFAEKWQKRFNLSIPVHELLLQHNNG